MIYEWGAKYLDGQGRILLCVFPQAPFCFVDANGRYVRKSRGRKLRRV